MGAEIVVGPSETLMLSLAEYQRIAKATDQTRKEGMKGLSFLLLGLFGEVGTLLSALKKKRRDRESYIGYSDAVTEEFGDVLWYFSNIASRASLQLSTLAQRAFQDLHSWGEPGEAQFENFIDLQPKRRYAGSADSPKLESAVIILAGKVGPLLHDFPGPIAKNRDVLSGHLVEILRALLDAALVADVDLQRVASINAAKTRSRWPSVRIPLPLFDEGYPVQEQLPRKIKMHIFEQEVCGKTYVVQQCNGINIGDRLTDNKIEDDDYRFHDVFHLAYAAVLGWSPVLRGHFRIKRKSDPRIDEGEDGQRAMIVEEGVSTLVFHRAEKLNYFDKVKSLDYSLLKMVAEFVSGYESARCPLWQWEKAILDGYAVFRKFQKMRGGIVIADLKARSISYKELSA